jgi:hypothetical protein
MVNPDYTAISPIDLNHHRAANAWNLTFWTMQCAPHHPIVTFRRCHERLFATDHFGTVNRNQNGAGDSFSRSGVRHVRIPLSERWHGSASRQEDCEYDPHSSFSAAAARPCASVD